MNQKTSHTKDVMHCFHCGLTVPDNFSVCVTIAGQERPMCCHGCEAVAQTIVDTGNAEYYRHRTESAATAGDIVPEFLQQISLYDHDRVQKEFVRNIDDGLKEVDLILEGITCAACLWLNQKHLRCLPGVSQADVNYSTHRAHVVWDPTAIKLSEIVEAIVRIGYMAHPYDARRYQAIYKKQKNILLKRMGVAYVLGMQIMIMAVALYSGRWSGIAQEYSELFRWLSMGLVIPIFIFSAQPFFQSAWNDIKCFQAGVDVPVSIGLLIAMSASVVATISGQGEVYFDSLAMFVALLLSARYLELVTRYSAAQLSERFSQSVPVKAHRLCGDVEELIMATELKAGDKVRVRPGDIIPCDGKVIEGVSCTDESLLSGESKPVHKSVGSDVIGGTVNIEGILLLEVQHSMSESVFSSIVKMIEKAHFEKPSWTKMVDSLAPWFVLSVLTIAVFVASYWLYFYPADWVWVTVSVLIVSCPCALSLATPLALSAATKNLMSQGVLVGHAQLFEILPMAKYFVFDKTGTLTTGKFTIESVHVFNTVTDTDLLQIAASIEQYSEHPLAKVILKKNTQALSAVTDYRNTPGQGLKGDIEGLVYYLGSRDYVTQASQCSDYESLPPVDKGLSETWVAKQGEMLGCITMRDSVRPAAKPLIEYLQMTGYTVVMLSGDNRQAVNYFSEHLGITESASEMLPQDKLNYIKKLQENKHKVIMMGDGINDAPVLKQADVSLSLQHSTDLAIANSDCVILSDNLLKITELHSFSQKTRLTIRQNIGWALVYNLTVLPLAASGWVFPWLAASGMALSSFIVTLNSMRLLRLKNSVSSELSNQNLFVSGS
ncbi:Type cbb3 cytochrome oxidase biogenesis protein CcoI; Copper-translocating P-type ATPase [hydrothermal vent metagenome]|uniref:Type cbb3 cytochrome oxidase biogenesis protein CcoI Copper-translocating P-type ATPase n=1 Tax=hydrothermal vent metagenome TaxID=652676 RepID=A0A3B0YUA7_9ZZZZ